jgi:hypothetical protein
LLDWAFENHVCKTSKHHAGGSHFADVLALDKFIQKLHNFTPYILLLSLSKNLRIKLDFLAISLL